MDDLSAMIGGLLNSKEGMAQLQNMAAALGLTQTGGQQTAQSTSTDADTSGGNSDSSLAGLTALLSGLSGQGTAPPPQPSSPVLDPKTLSLIKEAYTIFNTRDKNTELLLALKPHFTSQRQKKVDDALRIMGLIKLLPLLKESGILGNLLGGESK